METAEKHKSIEVKDKIRNLFCFLKATDADEIIVRTTLVAGGWHDNEFDAHAAGFEINRFINPEYTSRYEFAMCYRLVRKDA